jgi:hypothetical protein
MAALQSVQYIAQHIKDEDKDNEVISLLSLPAQVYEQISCPVGMRRMPELVISISPQNQIKF